VRDVEIDGKAVMDRVRRERDRFVGFVLDSVESFNPGHRLRGFVSFKDDHTLMIDDHTELTADKIVIATGSSPFIPDLLLGAGDRLIVNDDVFDWQDLPESVFISGPGVIGLELGQALSRLGVKVTVLGRSESVGGLADPEIKQYAKQTFQNEFDLQLNAILDNVKELVDGVEVTYTNEAGESVTAVYDYLLAATGRKPNIAGLGIGNTSLVLNKKGVPMYDSSTMQTVMHEHDSHIFIAGDANNDLPILHEAADEGKIAGANAATFPNVIAGHRRAPLGVVFTEPQIAQLGLRLPEIEAKYGQAYVVGEVSFEGQGRSRVMGKNQGILKVFADQNTGVLLGAEMFGPSAEHIGHLLAWALQQQLTVDIILEMPFYHPVIEEGVRTAFRDAQKKLCRPK
jgi:dihydrolipoamide dehydrogenase